MNDVGIGTLYWASGQYYVMFYQFASFSLLLLLLLVILLKRKHFFIRLFFFLFAKNSHKTFYVLAFTVSASPFGMPTPTRVYSNDGDGDDNCDDENGTAFLTCDRQ